MLPSTTAAVQVRPVVPAMTVAPAETVMVVTWPVRVLQPCTLVPSFTITWSLYSACTTAEGDTGICAQVCSTPE